MNIKRSLWMALCCVPLLWALGAGFGRDPHAVPSTMVGKAAPPFSLLDLNGTPVSLAALRGQPVLLNFWATWCYPCQAEHALLQATARQVEGRAHVLGILYQDDAAQARRFLAEHPSPYRHLQDGNSTTAIDYGVAGVPESFVVDGNGIIRHKQAGVLTPEVLAEHFVPLLAPAKPRTP